jgi:FkbM family methyltransferase
MNLLYRHAYPVYLPLYSAYKRIAERSKIRLINSCVKSGMTALDIGANIGFYTRVLSDHVGGSGRVHAFEPNADNMTRLQRGTRSRANVTLNRCAVAAQSGTAKLYLSSELNVDHRTFSTNETRQTIEIPTVAIDDYFDKNEIIDFIKIDVQGFEHWVLQGMRQTLERSPHVVLLSELLPWGLRQSGASVSSYVQLLREYGFRLTEGSFEECERLSAKENDPFFYTDIVAVKQQ